MAHRTVVVVALSAFVVLGCTSSTGGPPGTRLSGSLVAGFGGGVATSDPSGGNDEAFAVGVDADHFYVAGTKRDTGTSSAVQWQIEKRRLSDGSVAVMVNSDPTSGIDEPRALALTASHVVVLGTEGAAWRLEKRALADLALDGTFGTGGAVTITTGSTVAPAGLAIDATHLYLAGTVGAAWLIEKRSLATGALETTTFGGGTGQVTSDPSGLLDEVTAIAISASSMIVAGTSGQQWHVEKRSLATGDLDAAFGGGAGFIDIDPGAGSDRATAIAVDGTSIYVAGYATQGIFDREWRVEKIDAGSGAADGTFVPVVSNPSPGLDEPTAVCVAGASLLVVGFDEAGTSPQWRIERRNAATGGLDGTILDDPSASEDRPLAAALGAEHIISVGYDSTPGNRQWLMERHSVADGTLVPFGGVGFVTTAMGSAPRCLAIDGTYLYAAGGGAQGWRMEKRRLTDGARLGGFQSGMAGSLNAIAIDSAFVYLVGSSGAAWRIEKRSLATLQLEAAFGSGGIVIDGAAQAEAMCVAVDAGFVYAAGWEHDPGSNYHMWRVEKRSIATGSLVALQLSQLGAGISAHCIAIDGSSMVVGGIRTPSGSWGLEKRALSDLGLEPSFGSGGEVVEDLGPGDDRVVSVAIDGGSLYIAGLVDEFGSTPSWRVEKRSLTTGALDLSFGGGGAVLSAVEELGQMVIDQTSLYVVGSQASTWIIEKRHLATGLLDAGFGEGGVAVSGPEPGSTVALAAAVDSQHLYVLGKWDGDTRVEKRYK